jgi:hypothetical protein
MNTHKPDLRIRQKSTLVSRYSDWRSKHEASSEYEDAERGLGDIGRRNSERQIADGIAWTAADERRRADGGHSLRGTRAAA